jgi:hypothetical protein
MKLEKKTNDKFIFISCLSICFVFLSGCTSTQNKDKAVTTVNTNQQEEQVTKTPQKIAPKKVEPIKSPKLTKAKTVKPAIKKPIERVKAKAKAKVKSPTKIASVVEKPPLPEIALASLKQLPVNFNSGWSVALKKLPISNTETCVLYNEKNNFFDGYKDNNIKIYLSLSQLLVKSDSNFDLSYPETGVYVLGEDNNSAFYALTISSQKTIAVLALPLNDYIASTSKNLVMKSGFWPSWPVTDTKTALFPFTEVDSMIKTLNTCTSLLTAP